jgi:hypothetical protein
MNAYRLSVAALLIQGAHLINGTASFVEIGRVDQTIIPRIVSVTFEDNGLGHTLRRSTIKAAITSGWATPSSGEYINRSSLK